MVQKFHAGAVKTVMESDTFSERFERFCCSLIGKIEGVDVVPTSTTWDRGRDGRSVGGAVDCLVATSLTNKVEQKVSDDFTKIEKNKISSRKLYFCSSQPLSEHRCDLLKQEIFKIVGTERDVDVLGSIQLSELSLNWKDVVSQYYGTELDDFYQSIMDNLGSESIDNENLSLRLALCTKNHPNSKDIRKSMSEKIILQVLDDKGKNISIIAKEVANKLRLNRSVHSSYVLSSLELMKESGLCKKNDNLWEITEKGKDERESEIQTAGNNLLEGEKIFFEDLEIRLGYSLDVNQKERIWKKFKDGLSLIFHTRGLEIIHFISDFLDEKLDGEEKTTRSKKVIEDLAKSIGNTSQLGQQSKELEDSILSIFTEQTSKSFEWLSGICSSFVALCTLGIEHSSGKKIKEMVSKIYLIFDTDIFLSMLCEAENFYNPIKDLKSRWMEIGGKIWVGESTFNEALHHADRASSEYEKLKRLLPFDNKEEELHLIDNAFVRTFSEYLREKKAREHHWPQYIRQYSKQENLKEICKSENLHVISTPFLKPDEQMLVKRISSHIFEKKKAHNDDAVARGKSDRDGQLMANVIMSRRLCSEQGLERTYCIVSSSTLLKQTELEFKHEIGSPTAVISLAEASSLLSLVPDVSLGANSLKHLLFDDVFRSNIKQIEKLALLVIKDSKHHDLPWAKKKLLSEELTKVIIKESQMRGIDPKDFENRLLSEETSEDTINVLSQAIDQMPIINKVERQLSSAQQELEKKEKENEALRKEIERLKKGQSL